MASNHHALRVALAFTGVLAVMSLAMGLDQVVTKVAAGAVATLSIVVLAWSHRRRSGDASREAEILSQRLVENHRHLEVRLEESKDHHQALEHYFDTLMEQIPANLYFKDLDSHFLKVNRGMARSFRCGHPGDMLGKTDHDFFDNEHADQALADEKMILSTGKEIKGQIEHETFFDGKEGWVLTTKMPFRDRAGKIIGTFGMSSDVTDLVATRNTLERERNMLRSLIDSFPDKIFVRDPGRRYLVVNKAMAEWVGVDAPQMMLGKKPDDFFPELVAKTGEDEDLEVLASGQAVRNREWLFKTQKGDIRTMATTKVPLIDPEGRSWGVVGMDRDVTDERRAQESLIETEKRLQELMDNSPAVIYLKDLEGRYLMVNSGFEELFGISRGDVLGRSDHEFIADKAAADRFREHDLRVIECGEAKQIDEELYVEGEPRWYVSVRFPLRDFSGKMHAVGGISTDITDRKLAETEMKQLNVDLVQTNDDLQQAQEQLIQAEKMESVGRLASGVAHEVKNPLAMIGMGLELLARRIPEDDEKGQETIVRMKRGIDRAKKIVKGLVDFSSARQLALERMDLNEVVSDALALVDYQLRKGQVVVVEELGEGLPQVNLDATKIEQVIVNLMINAMHAMADGGTLTVRTYAASLGDLARDEGLRTAEHLRVGDRVVKIEIDDTGCGIQDENSGKLYDPFFTTKATGVGTGLGLTVSRKIIELHQGTLELANRPQGGVRATVMLKALPLGEMD